MSIPVIIDANIFLSIIIKDSQTQQAESLLKMLHTTNHNLNAPYLFRYEIIAAIRKHIHRGTLTVNEGIAGVNFIFGQPINYFTDTHLLYQGLDFANQFNLPSAYDAQYLALASYLNCDFWTGIRD